MVAHDVAWGENSVEPAVNPAMSTFQGVLSLGLIALFRLGNAKSYEEQKAVLDFEHPPLRLDFLAKAFKRANMARGSTPNNSFFNDPDTGPAAIWTWAHPTPRRGSVGQPDRLYLREWGYVMWDRTRIDGTRVLRSRWRPRPAQVSYGGIGEEFEEEWADSWERRSQIYNDGGRGWWDAEDESKVVWPQRKASRLPPRRFDPTSLDEAKRALLSMSQPPKPKES